MTDSISDVPTQVNFSQAVRAAVAAYARTGRMVDAALAFAANNVPVFPCYPGKNKNPRPERDRLNGKEVPRTGGHYKATVNADQIRLWWNEANYLIGVPMGPLSGVWCVDVDTNAHRVDGRPGWQKLCKEHAQERRMTDKYSGSTHTEVDLLVTREHRSGTDGPHLIFKWDAAAPVYCSRGRMPLGCDVKGLGGYIIVPPSVRSDGKAYTVEVDIEPVVAPAWLIKVISPIPRGRTSRPITAALSEVEEALQHCPNDDPSWEPWKYMAMAIYGVWGDDGLDKFKAFSQRWTAGAYDEDAMLTCWEQVLGSPPSYLGINHIFKIARENGWMRRAKPTYPAPAFTSVTDAEEAVRYFVRAFLDGTASCSFHIYGCHITLGIDLFVTVLGLRVETSIGKTRITVSELAAWLHAHPGAHVVYTVARLELGDAVVQRFRAAGVDARMFRGRRADDPRYYDPGIPKDDRIKNCLRLDAEAIAVRAGANVMKTCCIDGNKKCPCYTRCGYIEQMPKGGDHPQVWVTATDMLFHKNDALSSPAFIVIDEAFTQKGILETSGVPVDSLLTKQPNFVDATGERDALRNTLVQVLSQQTNDGWLERQHLTTLTEDICTRATSLEWRVYREELKKFEQQPGTSDGGIRRLAKSKLLTALSLSRKVIRIWAAVRAVLRDETAVASGRLYLTHDKNTQRCIELGGVRAISEQFKYTPTLLLDATLPAMEILAAFYPQVEIAADIKVAMPPAVHTTQILGAPTTAKKLIRTSELKDPDQHLHAVLLHILQWWFETGRGRTLVVCQMAVEKWLKEKLRGSNIWVRHYNDIAGIDIFKRVRLHLEIGRVAPGPRAMEALAGALSGRAPVVMPPDETGFIWYRSVARAIRMYDGSGYVVDSCDKHDDPLSEHMRYQTTEGELMQASGRDRAHRRTDANPLNKVIVTDVVLPITVNAVRFWKPPSLLIETAWRDGVMLTSPVDMVKLWPNTRAADRTLEQGVPVLPRFVEVTYQRPGPKQKLRTGYFDTAGGLDPVAWLEERFGPLVFPGRKRSSRQKPS
jgi:hypothetical protein